MTTTYWIEKSKENIEAAELLSREGFYAIANTRAYYAMFYAAQALLETVNLSFSKHSAVIAAFGKEFIKTGKLDPKLVPCKNSIRCLRPDLRSAGSSHE
jgi:uncharacterized protein (UPF0332 family)